jgi:hypothetical protein
VRRALLLVAAGPRTALADLLHAIEGVLTPGLPPVRELAPPVAGLAAGWYLYIALNGWLSTAARMLTGDRTLLGVLIEHFPAALVGVPLLRAASWGALEWWHWRRWLFGPGAVLALSPFVSIPGDFYLAGATLVTAALPAPFRVLRSDDLFLLLEQLDLGLIVVPGGRLAAGAVCTAGLALGTCLAGWLYLAGAAWHTLIAGRGSPDASAPRGPAS